MTPTQPRWQDVAIPAGSLFVVGDPKQSIYRFRRADIALFLDVRDRLNATERLTTNFRTVAPVLAWVNQVFGTVIQAEPGMQPAYEPLNAASAARSGRARPCCCSARRNTSTNQTHRRLRVREAADVASAITQALAGGMDRLGRDRRILAAGAVGGHGDPAARTDVAGLPGGRP